MSRASVLAVVALGAVAAAHPVLAQDRYGPSEPASAALGAPYPGAPYSGGPAPSGPAPFRGRTLNWPGKQDLAMSVAEAYAPPTATHAYVSQVYAPRAYAPPAYAQQPRAEPGYAARGYRAAAYPTATGTPGGPADLAFGVRPYATPAGWTPYAPRPYPGSTAARQPYAQPAPVRQAYMDAPTAQGVRRQAYASPSYTAPAAPSSDPEGWRPVFADAPRGPVRQVLDAAAPALAGAPSRPADPPTSIYTPASTPEMTPAQRAAAAPPPLRNGSAAQRYGYDPSQGHAVRFYSVHRPFGLQPDSAPIPPQFFTATADLSEPAGPAPAERTTTTASGVRVTRAVPDTSVN